MKTRLLTGAVSALIVVAVTTAFGQMSNSVWTLDENGPAGLIGAPWTNIFSGIVGFSFGTNKVDPASGIVGWYYNLGGGGGSNVNVAGDVVLIEPQDGSISDLLRFDGEGVFFFSDLEPNDPNPDKADVPVIPDPINPVILTEVGLEGGSNGVVYVPEVGQPGFSLIVEIPNVEYDIISDVPEPSTMTLVGLSIVGLLAIVRRRK